jgi:glycosyltransferase involved in cell wall biosynthesis
MWSKGIDSERVFYAPNGQSADRFRSAIPSDDSIRERLSLGDAPVVLLYTRFFEFSIKRIVEVFSRIHECRPDVEFLIVGEGRSDESSKFAETAASVGLDIVTTVTGWVDASELSDYLAVGDVAMYPMDDTLSNRSKCPAKLTELMVLGIPTVAEEVGQVGEYVVHDESGLLYPPGDIDRFADGVINLLDDEERQRTIGENARRRIVSKFGWDSIVGSIEEAYKAATLQAACSPSR